MLVTPRGQRVENKIVKRRNDTKIEEPGCRLIDKNIIVSAAL